MAATGATVEDPVNTQVGSVDPAISDNNGVANRATAETTVIRKNCWEAALRQSIDLPWDRDGLGNQRAMPTTTTTTITTTPTRVQSGTDVEQENDVVVGFVSKDQED